MGRTFGQAGAETRSREAAMAGTYLCRLCVDTNAQKAVWDNGVRTEQMEPAFKFEFTTTEDLDSQGQPYVFSMETSRVWTGGPNAKLTKVMKWLTGRPNLTAAEFMDTDLGELERQIYEVTVSVRVSQTSGNNYNEINMVAPKRKRNMGQPAAVISDVRQAPAPSQHNRGGMVPTPTDQYPEDSDPFADE